MGMHQAVLILSRMGRYIYDAINARDYPVIQSGILIIAFIFNLK